MQSSYPGSGETQQEQGIARHERRRVARRKAIPLLIALIVLFVAPACVYLLITAPLFRDPQAIPGRMNGLGNGMAIGLPIALLGLLWLVAVITLVMDGGKIIAARLGRADQLCPNCGLREGQSALRFEHKVIPGTGWQENACPQCHKIWHTRL